MDEIKVIPEDDYDQLVDIALNSYPAISTEKEKFKENLLKEKVDSPFSSLHGLYRYGKLVGIMRLFDFEMNFRGHMLNLYGIGMVGVDFQRKKEKIAKGLLTGYHNIIKEKKYSISALYPFRPDFYKKMGYGYGSKMYVYKIKPTSFSNHGNKKNVRFLTQDKDISQMHKCYMKYVHNKHGMFARSEKFFERFFKNEKNKIVGYFENNKLLGYLMFQFKRAKEDNFVLNDMDMSELIYNSQDALLGLSTFLHSQADQINRVIFTTNDEDFHFILTDARNGTNNLFYISHEIAQAGRGLMYRLINTKQFFEYTKEVKFGTHTFNMKLSILDSFNEENAGDYYLSVNEGSIIVDKTITPDVKVKMDVSDFSSLVMGTIQFSDLVKFGLADIDNTNFIKQITESFRTDTKPYCMTLF